MFLDGDCLRLNVPHSGVDQLSLRHGRLFRHKSRLGNPRLLLLTQHVHLQRRQPRCRVLTMHLHIRDRVAPLLRGNHIHDM